MNAAKTYATQLANDLTKITMTDFFKYIHAQFYPDQDISFMEYFLELCGHEDEFYVHHSKLVEYEIMTSNRSSVVKEKLDTLGLIEGIDYLLQDILQQLESGTKYSKVYYLTPQAFKKCLMRARRYANQPIDPVLYCDYYLLLEKVFKLYTDYERLYSEKLLSIKDDMIDRLQMTVEAQSQKMDEQSEQIAELLGYAKETTETLHDVQDDLTETKEIAEIAKSYLEEKSFNSTKPPSNENKYHYFGATTYFNKDKNRIDKFVTGQKDYVDRTISKRVGDKQTQR